MLFFFDGSVHIGFRSQQALFFTHEHYKFNRALRFKSQLLEGPGHIQNRKRTNPIIDSPRGQVPTVQVSTHNDGFLWQTASLDPGDHIPCFDRADTFVISDLAV